MINNSNNKNKIEYEGKETNKADNTKFELMMIIILWQILYSIL